MNKIMVTVFNSVFIVFTILVFSCSDSISPKPINLIQRDTMVTILTEIHITDAMISNLYRRNKEENKDIIDKYYADIFDRHNITQEDFENSFSYYLSQEDIIELMYKEVVDQLSSKKEEIKEKK